MNVSKSRNTRCNLDTRRRRIPRHLGRRRYVIRFGTYLSGSPHERANRKIVGQHHLKTRHVHLRLIACVEPMTFFSATQPLRINRRCGEPKRSILGKRGGAPPQPLLGLSMPSYHWTVLGQRQRAVLPVPFGDIHSFSGLSLGGIVRLGVRYRLLPRACVAPTE